MWVCLWGGVSNPLSHADMGDIRGINFQCLHKGKVDNHWDFSWSYHAKGTTLVALRRLTIDDQVLTRKYFLFYFDQFISLHFIIVEFHHLFCITFIVASPSMPRLICDAIESIFFILFSGYQTTEWICRERLSAGKRPSPTPSRYDVGCRRPSPQIITTAVDDRKRKTKWFGSQGMERTTLRL